MACPAAPTSPYTPVSVKGYQWLLVWALVKRGIAFIGNDQPGWRIWGIRLATGAHKSGEELGWAPSHHFPSPSPSRLDSVEILSLREELGLRKEGRGEGSGPASGQMLTGRVQVGRVCVGVYLVRAMTVFFLGCWITGLPILPFFREPFRASSRCFSAGEYGKEAVSCPQDHPTLLLRAA